MKGIQNVQKFWQNCGVVEAADSILNLLIRLNTIVPDSMRPHAHDAAVTSLRSQKLCSRPFVVATLGEGQLQ